MTNTITPKHKDIVLKYLVEKYSLERSHTLYVEQLNEIYSLAQIDFNALSAIFKYFERIDLVSSINLKRIGISFVLVLESHDIINRGGFEMQETILLKNIELLLAEIENLQPSPAGPFERITTIAASIATFLSYLKS